jgi:hypothetical protein
MHMAMPKLRGTNLRWKGWHGFQRGLATTLYELGVPAEIACLILRNDVDVTRHHYLNLAEPRQKA